MLTLTLNINPNAPRFRRTKFFREAERSLTGGTGGVALPFGLGRAGNLWQGRSQGRMGFLNKRATAP
jgi:hypothetical protein